MKMSQHNFVRQGQESRKKNLGTRLTGMQIIFVTKNFVDSENIFCYSVGLKISKCLKVFNVEFEHES